jgi:hypothetical protein
MAERLPAAHRRRLRRDGGQKVAYAYCEVRISTSCRNCCARPNSIYQLSGVHLTGAFGRHIVCTHLRVRLP